MAPIMGIGDCTVVMRIYFSVPLFFRFYSRTCRKKEFYPSQINTVPLVVSQKFGREAVAGPAMGQWKHEI